MRAELPGLGEKALQLIFIETRRIAAGNHPQQGLAAVVRAIGPGHAGWVTEYTAVAAQQPIPRLQRRTLAVQATEALALLGADAAQYRHGAKAACHRRGGARPAAGKAQLQARPGAHGKPRPERQRPAIQA